MKEKPIIFFGLVAALGCVALLFYISLQIEHARERISWTNAVYGVGMFNHTNQTANNLFQLTNSLHNYRAAGNTDEKERTKKQYLVAFDVLWANIVSLRQMDKMEASADVHTLKDNARALLQELDPVFKPQVTLTDIETREIITKLNDLFTLNKNVGNSHFLEFSASSDDVDLSIARLQRMSRLLILTFGLSLITVFVLLWRIRSSEHRQSLQLKSAHDQMTLLVNDLRSGQVEKRAKNQFLAAASHDLRQPLHALGLFLNSLEKKVTDVDGQHLLGKIRSSTQALHNLFDSLLDISRLDAGVVEIHKKHIALESIFHHLREEFSELALQNNIELQIEPTDLIVYTDDVLFLRIVRNLMENAFLHAPESDIKLSANLVTPAEINYLSGQNPAITDKAPAVPTTPHPRSHDEKNLVRLSLSDDGPGIPASQHQLVFSEYYQIKNPERDRNKGLGLGLSIVKRLSDLLQHDLQLESDTTKGTTFFISLPQGERQKFDQSANQKMIANASSSDIAGLTVVVIDDEIDIRTGMEVILENAGCTVLTSESSSEAISLLVKTNLIPDIIIADYRLRDNKTGSQAVEEIREELNTDTPAFLITGDTSPIRVREASESGIRLLHKPVLPEVLFAVIDEVARETPEENYAEDAELQD